MVRALMATFGLVCIILGWFLFETGNTFIREGQVPGSFQPWILITTGCILLVVFSWSLLRNKVKLELRDDGIKKGSTFYPWSYFRGYSNVVELQPVRGKDTDVYFLLHAVEDVRCDVEFSWDFLDDPLGARQTFVRYAEAKGLPHVGTLRKPEE